MCVVRQTTFALLLLSFAAYAAELRAETASDRLRRFLVSLGYTDVILDECLIRFSRDVVPSGANNGFYRYERLIHLDSISRIGSSEILRMTGVINLTYALRLETTPLYYESYRKVYSFQSWLRENHPEVTWPYLHPQFHNELTPFVEGKAHAHILEMEDLNLWIDYSNFGRVSRIERDPAIMAADTESLSTLRSLLAEYSARSGCSEI